MSNPTRVSPARPGSRVAPRPAVDPAAVLGFLKSRHQRTVGVAVLGLIVGASLLLLFGTVLVSVVMFVCLQLTGSSQYPFAVWFAAYLLLLVPWLVVYAKRYGGSVYGDAVIGSGMFSGAPSSYGEYRMRSGVASMAMYAELLLWGPKTVVESTHALLGAGVTPEAIARMTRASEAMAQLLAATDGQPIASLRKPDEGHEVLGQAIGWLVRNDHAGISSDRQRIWASGDFRRRFAAWSQSSRTA